jgi:hypothetical protein
MNGPIMHRALVGYPGADVQSRSDALVLSCIVVCFLCSAGLVNSNSRCYTRLSGEHLLLVVAVWKLLLTLQQWCSPDAGLSPQSAMVMLYLACGG